MWSYRLNKIKSSKLHTSITNSTALAEEQVEGTLINMSLKKYDVSFFSKKENWQYAIELFSGSVVLALVLILAETQHWQEFNFYHFLQYLFFINWVLFTLIAIQERLQHFISKLSLSQSLILSFVLLQVIVFVTTSGLNFFLYLGRNLNIENLSQADLFENVVLHLSYGILLGAFCFRYLYVREQWIRQQHSELQAKVNALQARIHPHFLFNSLNNVVSLIATDPEKAECLLINLSRLFRASLQELKLVSLLDEVELCQKYLEIEKIRLGDRLNIEWKLEQFDQFSQVQIPLLTLQPLLENSIFHGVEKKITQSTVTVLIEVLQKKVNIVITNPCVSEKPQIRQHHGIAIKNVKQRLEAYYGQSVIFQVYQNTEIYTTIIQYECI